MNIAFLTSCLEPGKDGVGDYTRSLARECTNQGHKCLLISFNDFYRSQLLRNENDWEAECIQLIRSPNALSNPVDTEYIRNSLVLFKPAWVSLQFSPYGIQKKGVIFNLNIWLSKILNDSSLHVMFHELWIGDNLKSSLKDKVVGYIQRYFILKFINKYNPKVIHTSNNAYLSILKYFGINASRLKMFGCIPPRLQETHEWLYSKLQAIGCDISEENRSEYWLFGFFGSLHKQWSPEPLFTYLRKASQDYSRKIILISIGKLGIRGEDQWKFLCDLYSKNMIFLKLGEQPVNKISSFFNLLDFGMAASPKLLLGKSSSVAAMLEHRLPVIINRYDCQFSSKYTLEKEDEPLFIELDASLPEKLSHFKIRGEPFSQCKLSTTQFLYDLFSTSK
jgi:hypothetical protein